MKRDPNCTMCRLHKTAEYVCMLGQGPEPCEVMIVGEAPGKREDDSGKPFVGRSGQFLEEILERFGFSRKNVFITNAVSCRPPDNRTPSKAEIRTCKAWLDYQIKLVKPKYVLLLGNVPLLSITGKSGIKKKRGKPFERGGIIYLPTYHPAFILRAPENQTIFERDIEIFKSIVKKGEIPREDKLNFIIVDTPTKFHQMLDALKHETEASFDLETSCLYPWAKGAKVLSIGFGVESAQYILPTTIWTSDDVEDMVRQITDCLPNLICHLGKFDCLWMMVHYGVKWHEKYSFDTCYGYYLVDENDFHGLKYMAQKFLGAPDWDIDKQDMSTIPLEKLVLYHAHDLYYTRALKPVIERMLKREGPAIQQLMTDLMMPVARLFVEVEFDGVCVDKNKFDDAEKYLIQLKDEAEKSLQKWGKINWGSPQQVADLLFNKLKLEIVEKTKGGKPSTSESVLNQLDHPCVETLLKFRGAKQQLSFFIDGWKPYIHKRYINGELHWFLHPSFKLTGTVTGRPSCEHPNLQQVPRDERIRSLIVAPPGWVLVDADLSQIELRIAAELGNVQSMINAFKRGEDIHWRTMINSIKKGGENVEKTIETIKLLCMQYKLPASGRSSEILYQVFKNSLSGEIADNFLQICCKDWTDKESRYRKRRERPDFSYVERRVEVVANKKVSQNLLRALLSYCISLSSSQRPEFKKLESIEFSNAVQTLSSIGPSIAEGLDKSWKEVRKKAKAEGFGFVFGMWYKKFKRYARDNYGLELTEEEAKEARESYFELYPELLEFHKKQKRYVQQNGYVTTLTGRKRRLPKAMEFKRSPERDEAERQAINSPVQGFAAELNLMSAVQLRKEFNRNTVRIVGTVHDSILFWVRKKEAKKAITRLLEIMKHPEIMDQMKIEFKVPIEADASIGPWSQGIPFQKWGE